MKKILQLSFITLFLLACFAPAATAQKKEKKKDVDEYFDESGGFKHRLWFGGSGTLGFSGFNGSNQFQIGVSPMVGYKIFEKWSVGPRVSVDYILVKTLLGGGQSRKDNFVFYSLSAFSRFKILPTIFAHVEYEHERLPEGAAYEYDNQGQVVGFLRKRNNFYAGLGYTSGGLVAYEIYLLYNFLEDESSSRLPIEYRAGLTYKF